METNKKGVPNERSGSILSSYLSDVAENSTFAPLNIPRWDNELFVQRKNNMIKDVEVIFEKHHHIFFDVSSHTSLLSFHMQTTKFTLLKEKFVYPSETKQLTRDWVLMTVCKRWRAYKSHLKKKYFKCKEKSLQEIISNFPVGVNKHQWETLVGMWCQDSHMVIISSSHAQTRLQN